MRPAYYKTTKTTRKKTMEKITVQTAPQAQHHEFSPSKLQQYRDCPGSYKMQMGMPDNSSEEAKEGSMLHACIATGNFDGLTEEQSELCAACLQFLAEIAGGENSGATIYHELPIQVRDANGNILTEGTVDVAIVFANGELATIDWKFGRTPVTEVNRNMQLATYSVGVMQKFGGTRCTGHVFQPRIYSRSQYTFSRPDAIITNIARVIDCCKDNALLLNAETDACKYCRAKSKCPAFMAKFNVLAINEVNTLDNPETLAALYETSKQVETFCREIKAAMEQYIDAHGECCGYRYKERPGNRECTDVLGAYQLVQAMITPAEFTKVCKVSIGGLTDALVVKMHAAAVAKGEKLTKAAAKVQVDTVLAAVVQCGAATKSIVMG